MNASDIECVQRWYPQIYLACHKRHIRAGSTVHRLSSRDSSLLSHLNGNTPMTAAELAAHLGVRPSTLSAALAKLEGLGYLCRQRAVRDRRTVALTLTTKGKKAMADTSVLDRARVAALLARLTEQERRQALGGLALLARAACENVNPRAARRRS